MTRHPAAHTQDAGFSLTEVLAAVFIVAVASTFIVLAGPEQPDALTRQAQTISTLMSRSADEAIISGQTRGLSVTQDGYQALVWRERTWQPITSEVMPYETNVRLVIERLDTSALSLSKQAVIPTLIMDPTGFSQAEPITFELGNDILTITMATDGTITQERTNERRF